MAFYIKAETRNIQPECYPDGLACAIHFSVIGEDGKEIVLNSDYGILFAQGCVNEKNEIVPAFFENPLLSKKNGLYYVTAKQVLQPGDEGENRFVSFQTTDFITFESCEMVDGEAPLLEVSENIAQNAVLYWNKLYNTEVKVPELVEVAGMEELEQVRAVAVYNDGSTHEKRVMWDIDAIDFTQSGKYQIKGKVVTPKYDFPLAENTGDPVFLKRGNDWYYIYTHDSNGDIGLYIRRAETVQNLFVEGKYEENILLDKDEERGFVQTFWAPEFHEIGGNLYILFAVGGKVWGPQCHMMCLKPMGDIFKAEDWTEPVKVLQEDGSALAEGGITLDMTYIEAVSGSYMVWSSRYNCMSEGDSGSMLCIARTDPKQPWRLTSKPVILSRPLYGFENVSGTINNEGPYAFKKNGKVYLTYSGGSANRFTYTLGLLTVDEEKDLTQVENWHKAMCPVLHFHNTAGRFGAGHNSFFTDEDGNMMIAYHAEPEITSSLRCTGMNRVHFDSNGRPRFDMMPQEDLKEELAEVTMQVCIK